jgi:glycosyltransferase involved in cell wall biosynthesis
VKIVHINPYFMPSMGYQERYLATHQTRMGHQVWIVTSVRKFPPGEYQWLSQQLGADERPPGAYTDELPGVTVVRLACRLQLGHRIWMKGLEDTLRAIGPDIVVAHGLTGPHVGRVLAMKLSRRLGPKCAVVVDDHMLYSAAPQDFKHLFVYKLVSLLWTPLLRSIGARFVGVSGETGEFMKEFYGLKDHEVEVIPLGVDADLFRFDPEGRRSVRQDHGIPEGDVVIIETGKLIPPKGQHLLLEGAVPVLRRRVNAWLMLVGAGDPDYTRSLKETAAREGVAARVLFVPAQPHNALPAYYSAADIAVWPMQESMSVLDASSCNLPVVLRDSAVGRERTTEGRGRNYSTIPDLSRILDELVENPELRREMGRQGRSFIERNLDWRVISRRFVDVTGEGPSVGVSKPVPMASGS